MEEIKKDIENVEVFEEENSLNQAVEPYSTEEELTDAM